MVCTRACSLHQVTAMDSIDDLIFTPPAGMPCRPVDTPFGPTHTTGGVLQRACVCMCVYVCVCVCVCVMCVSVGVYLLVCLLCDFVGFSALCAYFL
jgi:hypothetical protein